MSTTDRPIPDADDVRTAALSSSADSRSSAQPSVEVEGHGFRNPHDAQEGQHTDDTQGHLYGRWSDERLKQAVEQVSDALATLRQIDTGPQPDEDDTQGHAMMRWSDERLKQALAPIREGLSAFHAVRVARP